MAKNQTDVTAKDLAQWKDYMEHKVPVVIYTAPARWNLTTGNIVVAPKEKTNWVIGNFGSITGAQEFCEHNSLSFEVFESMPKSEEPVSVMSPA